MDLERARRIIQERLDRGLLDDEAGEVILDLLALVGVQEVRIEALENDHRHTEKCYRGESLVCGREDWAKPL